MKFKNTELKIQNFTNSENFSTWKASQQLIEGLQIVLQASNTEYATPKWLNVRYTYCTVFNVKIVYTYVQ